MSFASMSRKQQAAQTEAAAAARGADLQTLQTQSANLQRAIQDDGAAFAQEMAALQANDAQLVQQLNDTLAQLQNAYNEIAARQASDASMNSGRASGEQDHEDHDDNDDHDETGEHGSNEHDD